MKQRVRVVAIVQDDDRVLLLERSTGRLDSDGKQPLEMLNGKMDSGEQPEDAVVRLVHESLGKSIKSIKLSDVVTLVDRLDNDTSSLYIIYSITLPGHKIRINMDRYTSFSWASLQDMKGLNISSATAYVLEVTRQKLHGGRESVMEPDSIEGFSIVHTDGGSRGNPGPSGAGYYILSPDGTILARGGEFIGITNSRQAEYVALKLGIEKSLELGLRKVVFKLDSLMVVGHMNGMYKIKNRELWPIYDEIIELLKRLESYSFMHIRRELNIEADTEVNRVLDEESDNMI